jgi:hypothetical protein
VEKFAFPPPIVPVPKIEPLLLNVTTCPFGRPPLLVRVAVIFTEFPDFEGLRDEDRVIVICAGLTVCVRTDEVAWLWSASPLCLAVMLFAPILGFHG